MYLSLPVRSGCFSVPGSHLPIIIRQECFSPFPPHPAQARFPIPSLLCAFFLKTVASPFPAWASLGEAVHAAVTWGPAFLSIPSFLLPRAFKGRFRTPRDRERGFQTVCSALVGEHSDFSAQQERGINPSLTYKREFRISERPAEPD